MDRSAKQAQIAAYLSEISEGDGAERIAAETDIETGFGPFGEASRTELTRAKAGLEKVAAGADAGVEELAAVEAIILPRERPVIDIHGGGFEIADQRWAHFASGGVRETIESAIPLIGRIEAPELPHIPYAGTGFLVGPDLLMTNRHVAELFASGLGQRGLQFRPGQVAKIDFRRETEADEAHLLSLSRIEMIHPYWDMAILRVQGLPKGHAHLTLSVEDTDQNIGGDVAVIGYPAFDPRNNQDLQRRLFRGRFNVKRLLPGKLRPRGETPSYGRNVNAVRHDSSTLGGNSGSAVVNVATGMATALHFAGRYLVSNYAVPAIELARDARVADAGVAFERAIVQPSTAWDAAWAAADGAEVSSSASVASPAAQTVSDGGAAQSWTIPLTVTVNLGAPQAQATTPASARVSVGATPSPAASVEATVVPAIDPNYDNRRGYQAGFLDSVDVPMPQITDLTQAATLLSGPSAASHIAPYEHFSLIMHKERRLAVITAANVDGSDAAKEPEPGRDYTRKGLGGLEPNDREKWTHDERFALIHQLPDRFFTEDGGAFDRGHVVRRDDVAWGANYDEVRRANGDTFHTTNCSPQVLGFNRSNRGVLNWGDLENHVLSEAETEKLQVFAGPVLDPDDRAFKGRDFNAQGFDDDVMVQIPSRYWKVIVARRGSEVESFGFVLEQDLSNVPTVPTGVEFAAGAFSEKMRSIAEIEAMTGDLVRFADIVRDSDQIDQPGGEAVRSAAGLR